MYSAFDAIVSGRVQMVMYRDFCQRKAQGFGIVGEVQNLPDEMVRVHAEGEREKLEAYIEKLKQGPILTRVENVAVTWGTPTGAYKRFTIRY